MARNVRLGNLVLNIDGFHDLRTGPDMDKLALDAAKLSARAATSRGIQCRADPSPGRNRARAVVIPDTAEDALETARHVEVMLYALDAARHVI